MTFLDTANDALIAYAKQSAGNTVLVAVNLDPHQAQEGLAIVPASLGLPPSFAAHDLLTDERFQWRIGPNYVRLEARRAPGPRAAGRDLMVDRVGRPAHPHPSARRRVSKPPAAARRARARDASPSPDAPVVRSRAALVQASIFYEIHVRGFYDANGDGIGDFRGLTEKLDYLQWLGIDCIWLLPFYKSPLRDGGYDIADFTNIHSDYGNVDDVQELIDAAHARRIRVIADLVMNHTSTDHPWFQASRHAPRARRSAIGTCGRTPSHRYEDARIIFIDTESSNWSWDDEAGAYYWHRFFSHQPDLNY